MERIMIPAIAKRTVTIDNHKTSVTLEDEFWSGLREVARRKNATLRSLVTQIDDARGRNNLSSAIRVFVLNYYRAHRSAFKTPAAEVFTLCSAVFCSLLPLTFVPKGECADRLDRDSS